MPKKTDLTNYSQNTISQFVDLVSAICNHASAMGCELHTVYFTCSDIERELGISRYYAKKLINQLLSEKLLHKEKLRYRLSLSAPILNIYKPYL